ncbi:dTDP-4-amino-4,6-dideoxygalactose transaminase [Vibrio sp. MA40-2]|uniref:dTDP-4-amino-4,6-dideoxygalactose transaminase n=1 Tax=Vibrio sp. MA40-2 TaxID=3391828 RepID=UPI0039A6EF2A
MNSIKDAIENGNQCGDGFYSKSCEKLIEEQTGTLKALLTPSCTAALELSAVLIDIQSGDEIILPSYTFVSTVNAFVLRGGKPIFVDIEPNTMNIDPLCIENAITDKTKAIIVVHYAGVACDMDKIMAIAKRYNLYVIEDAAQAVGSYYRGQALGTIGHFGAFSYHATKNITSGGEGGALLINDKNLIDRAEIFREKGTNRKQFMRGSVDKYSWVDIGSSFLPSEIQAAYLFEQLKSMKLINEKRITLYEKYKNSLANLVEQGTIRFGSIPDYATNNGHMFFVKCNNLQERTALIKYLKDSDIQSTFHYVPLHTSPKGMEISEFRGIDNFTTSESEKLMRLPLFYDLTIEDVDNICGNIYQFYKARN